MTCCERLPTIFYVGYVGLSYDMLCRNLSEHVGTCRGYVGTCRTGSQLRTLTTTGTPNEPMQAHTTTAAQLTQTARLRIPQRFKQLIEPTIVIEVVINRHFRKEFAASVAVVVRPSPHFLSPPQHALPMNSAGITAMFFSFSGGRVFLAILPQMQSDAGTVLIYLCVEQH